MAQTYDFECTSLHANQESSEDLSGVGEKCSLSWPISSLKHLNPKA